MADQDINGDFASLIDEQECASPQMPLMHTTDLYKFRSIIAASTLSGSKCKVFGDDKLLYLFYGRPSFRPNANAEASSILAYRPVCFILEPDAVSDPKRLFPFDTGAYARGLYGQHVHEDMDLSGFSMTPAPESMMRLVNKYYGNNRKYYMGEPLRNVTIPNFQFEANSYYNIISESGETSFDDRRSTVEVQISEDIELSKATVSAVVMPTAFADEPAVRNAIITKWKADILPYPSYHSSPAEDVRSIFDVTLRYLEDHEYV